MNFSSYSGPELRLAMNFCFGVNALAAFSGNALAAFSGAVGVAFSIDCLPVGTALRIAISWLATKSYVGFLFCRPI
jgi:hypothetical protein